MLRLDRQPEPIVFAVSSSHLNLKLLVVAILIVFATVHCKPDDSKTSKCTDCRDLVKKFLAEFKATDRGLYEGGDTDWEVKNLKDYRRSEVRFIEITENIYKAKEDKINKVLEEVEENLEEFWQQHWDHLNDKNTNELDEYLCVSLLKSCCAFGFFGPQCSPCDLGDHLIGCSGRGKCNGNGTRSGTGECECEKGHRGSYCEECKKGFKREDDAIKNSLCIDIDECKNPENPNPCEDGKYCLNKPGYYACKKCHDACNNLTCTGPEPEDCTGASCAEGFELIESDSDAAPLGCQEIEDEEMDEGILSPKFWTRFLSDVPLEVYTVGVYMSLVALGSLVLAKYNKMVALTMIVVSLLFGTKHYSMFTANQG